MKGVFVWIVLSQSIVAFAAREERNRQRPNSSPYARHLGNSKVPDSLKQKYGTGIGRVTNWEVKNVNSDRAQNNCVYCTAAGVRGTTVNKLTQKGEGPVPMYMDSNYIKNPKDIQRINQQSGFPNNKFTEVSDRPELKQLVSSKLNPGQTKKFGLAYANPNGNDGHVVALNAWKNNDGKLKHRIVDFQKPVDQRFSKIPVSNKYYLFEYGKKQNNQLGSGSDTDHLVNNFQKLKISK